VTTYLNIHNLTTGENIQASIPWSGEIPAIGDIIRVREEGDGMDYQDYKVDYRLFSTEKAESHNNLTPFVSVIVEAV